MRLINSAPPKLSNSLRADVHKTRKERLFLDLGLKQASRKADRLQGCKGRD